MSTRIFPPIEALLFGHTSQETAYVVEDYPYGFRLRCKMRHWVETHPKHGDRHCTQTTNPKVFPERWNAVKKSTYYKTMFLYLNEEGHVKSNVFHPYDEKDFPAEMDFLISILDKLNKNQMEKIRNWYYSNTMICRHYRLPLYHTEEGKKAFAEWTINTTNHILSCPFEKLLDHPQAPLRDDEEKNSFYIGNLKRTA